MLGSKMAGVPQFSGIQMALNAIHKKCGMPSQSQKKRRQKLRMA